MRIIASHNIIILPKNWCFCNSFTAHQTPFQIQFSKNHPRRNLKNHAEKVVGLYRWQRQRAEPLQTSFSNLVRASFRICSHRKYPRPSGLGYFLWLGMRDSNPRSRDQNPLPYHLANPHWLLRTEVIIPIYFTPLNRDSQRVTNDCFSPLRWS